MKNLYIILLFTFGLGQDYSLSWTQQYDRNGATQSHFDQTDDGMLNILDIVQLVNIILRRTG